MDYQTNYQLTREYFDQVKAPEEYPRFLTGQALKITGYAKRVPKHNILSYNKTDNKKQLGNRKDHKGGKEDGG